jgi:hypothetical protein
MDSAMAKRKSTTQKAERRPRAEIDRNYFLGDVCIKTGAAVGVALTMIALYTPFSFQDALDGGMYGYLALMGGFALVGVVFYLAGRHLRHEATHWDFD